MNVKGIKLNKKLILLLNDSIDNINKTNLSGLECFNSFSWKGFNKEEFKNLLNLFVNLNNQHLFDNISDNQTFIFNYSTDITELDIVTIMKSNDKAVLIDIESKNGNDPKLKDKIITQINNRKNDQLPQLIKNQAFLTIGFVNNNFIKGYYFDGNVSNEFNDNDELYNLLKNFEEYASVEDYLIRSSNLASISKVCKDIEAGTYKFYSDTNKIYDSLISKIDNEDAYVVYGNAGTGKSVLAFKLFFENPNSKLLMLNSKMYYSLDFNKKYYYEGRATFNSDIFMNLIDKDSISIVDECQRLSYETIVEIIKKSKITYLFGDHRQVFQKNGIVLTPREFKNRLIKDNQFKVSLKTMTKSRRYSDEVSKSLEFLIGRQKDTKDLKLPSDYQINLYYDESDFLNSYFNTEGIKKIYVPINQLNENKILINGKEFVKVDYKDDDFSIWADSGNYYGTTYHALSFDIDHCFVYLKNICLLNKNKKQVMFYKKDYEDNEIILFLNELNVLFTRGKKSLNIYVADIEVYLYLNKLLKQII